MSRTTKPAPNSRPTSAVKPANLSWKEKLHPEEYESLKNTFDLFDEDHSGLIDPEQINKILGQLGESRKDTFIYSLIGSLRSKNKPINFEQFLQLVVPKVGDIKTKQGLRTIFNHLDKNEDELLEFQDLKALSRLVGDNITDDDVLQIIHDIHVNLKTESNNGLTFDDFYSILTKFYKK